MTSGVNAIILLLCVTLPPCCVSGNPSHSGSYLSNVTLDPSRYIAGRPESETHVRLTEQYIWTQQDAVPLQAVGRERVIRRDQDIGEHYFRRSFSLDAVPRHATLYVAGPRSATIYLNGRRVLQFRADLDSSLHIQVFSCDVSTILRRGRNVLALEAVRGPDIATGEDNSRAVQLSQGKILLVKLLPAERGVNVFPLLISDAQWRASMRSAAGWEDLDFDDSSWPVANSLGSPDSSIEFLQWGMDTGLYDWPGYDGISPFLSQYDLSPDKVENIYAGTGQIFNADALTRTGITGVRNEFRVQLPSRPVNHKTAPQIMLDFGREVVGRLEVRSDANLPGDITIQYGESKQEALYGPYLGVIPLHIAAHATAYGPKSAFRFVLIRFIHGEDIHYKFIRLAGIEYPVKYHGFFESSDSELNRLWMIGAYTAHLCMQDDIWDAPKRDRGRYAGDLDVSGRTIDDVFLDRFLMEDTLARLIGNAPVTSDVNGIPGYSAFWIMDESEYYRHTGSEGQLLSFHDRLVQLMNFMMAQLDGRGLYASNAKAWPFVDWSSQLHSDTPEARRATQMEVYAGIEQGIYLLRQMGDVGNAEVFQKRAALMRKAAQRLLFDVSTDSFGTRWQTNAMAVLSGIADRSQYNSIWQVSLSSVGHTKCDAFVVSPYYNYYIISAMAKMGHREAALNWIRKYWGGMLNEGATSFWEAYDLCWPKGNFHVSLQADDTSGYRISLAHGWSTGVTPWLMEQVLGIHATGPGFSTVKIRPDLIDLQWVKGGEPTPRGMLDVSIRRTTSYGAETTIVLPPDTCARIYIGVPNRQAYVVVNGQKQPSTPAEDGKRAIITIASAGRYVIHSQEEQDNRR